MEALKTYVAPLLSSKGIPIKTPNDQEIYWLDELFGESQMRVSSHPGRPLIVLLVGPPGAGKSLLVQQICYNIARSELEAQNTSLRDATSLIISTETSARDILDNLNRLGCVNHKQGTFCVYDESLLPNPMSGFDMSCPLMVVTEVEVSHLRMNSNELGAITKQIQSAWTDCRKKLDGQSSSPKIVVVDSLNVLATLHDRGMLFDSLIKLFDPGPRFLFLSLDAPLGSVGAIYEHAYWEYVADISIYLNYRDGQDRYFVRELEIAKTRQQSHSLGKFLLKILPKPERNDHNLSTDPEGARPNVYRGGVFVFPSIHYTLSKIRAHRQLVKTSPKRPALSWAKKPKKGQPAKYGPGELSPPLVDVVPVGLVDWSKVEETTLNWPVKWCFELVGGGVPFNRCTALVGRRGARKSYFGYQFLLDGIRNGERTMVVSFRDNPEATKQTLNQIAPSYDTGWKPPEGNPVIVYQRPGYVAPEEFLHRVISSVGEYSPTRVLINAVDQWEAGYPLLHSSAILVPALIDFLNAHQITSMVVGVDRDRQTLRRYGLTASAEVV